MDMKVGRGRGRGREKPEKYEIALLRELSKVMKDSLPLFTLNNNPNTIFS